MSGVLLTRQVVTVYQWRMNTYNDFNPEWITYCERTVFDNFIIVTRIDLSYSTSQTVLIPFMINCRVR